MFAEWDSVEAAAAVAGLHAGRAALNALAVPTLTDADLLTLLREQEAAARAAVASQHAVIAELDSRGTAREHGCASTAVLLSQVLRLNPGQARDRVTAAANLGPRRGLTGEVLPPLFAEVAAAQAAGVLCVAQARVITDTIDTLPDPVRAEHGQWLQQSLVEQAHSVSPVQLAQLARAMAYALDQDGVLVEEH
ncbi:MAG: hypothetical protein QOF87_737, partial [Pseudonocardiales bacterium]|nr:hypothetical protein [Pseudonocardiales bacterium]